MTGKIWPACDAPMQRLSKPRTNTSSSNLLTLASQQGQQDQPSSPLTPSEHPLYSEDVTVQASQGGDRRSRRKSRTKIREYLHGQSSEEEESQKQKGIRHGVRDRLSRSSSSLVRLANGKSTSTQASSISSGELDRTNSELVHEKIKEKAYNDSLAARNHVSEPIDDEDMHPDAMKSPIRRSSLYTPGLATRTPDDLLRKPPQPGEQDKGAAQPKNDTDVSSSPSALGLAALSPIRNAALIKSQNGRSTPTDFNQLGTLGLGTLRIMNGVSSPEPAANAVSQKHPSIVGRISLDENEYYTASEGLGSEDDFQATAKNSARGTPKATRRSGSPLKYENYWPSVVSQRQPPPSPSPPSEVNYEVLEHTFRACDSTQKHSDGYFSQLHLLSNSPDRASVFAQDYMSELAPSPYKTALPITDTLQSTVCRPEESYLVPDATEFPGSLTQDQAIWAGEAQSPPVDVWRSLLTSEAEARHANSTTREDAYRTLSGECLPRNESEMASNQRFGSLIGDRDSEDRRDSLVTTASNTLSRSDWSSGSEHANLCRAAARPMYQLNRSNVDSGYISRVDSTKSLHGETKDVPAANSEPWLEHYRSVSGPRDMPQQPLRGAEAYQNPSLCYDTGAHSRPMLEVVPRPHTTITTSTDSLSRSQSQPVVPSITASPTDLQASVAGPALDGFDRESTSRLQQTVPYEQSVSSREIFPVKTRKLRKTRKVPKGVDMTAVQEINQLTVSDIPDIPQQLVSQNATRLHDYPTFDYTCPDFWNEEMEDSEPSAIRVPVEPLRFPSPTNSIEDRGNAIMNANIDWPKSSKRKKKEKAEQIKAEEASKTKQQDHRTSEGEVLAGIADFGTVSHSIGNSPYDVAKSQTVSRSRASSSASRSHPHQISTDMPRTKSVIEKDDPAAAEASRFRAEQNSKQMAVRPQTPGQVNYLDQNSMSRHRSRSKSISTDAPHALPFDKVRSKDPPDAHKCGLRGRMRPHSMFVDAPPVPTLPSANETQQLEAMVRRDRRSDVPLVQTARSSNRPAILVRPKSMYASATSVASAPQQWPSKQRFEDQSVGKGLQTRPQSMYQKSPATSGEDSVQKLERTNTAIYRGNLPPHLSRPESTHMNRVQGRPQADRTNLNTAALPQVCPGNQESILPVLSPGTPSKLKKRLPESVKPDIWKSDSLKDKVKEDGGEVRKSNNLSAFNVPLEPVPAESNHQEARGEAQSERQGSASEIPLRTRSSAGRVSWPIPAQSLHDALRVHSEKRTESTDVSPLPSTADTPREMSNGPISPLSTTQNEPPSSPANRNSYFSQTPTRKARPPTVESSQGTPFSKTRSRCPSPPSVLDGMPVGDMDVFPASPRSERDAQPDGKVWDEDKKRWSCLSVNSQSSPKTSTKRFSLNLSPSKTMSPVISNPTADIADSYASHSKAAPAPPAFSIPRKRLLSLSCFNATPSALSLKPVRDAYRAHRAPLPEPQRQQLSPPKSTLAPSFEGLSPTFTLGRFENLAGRYQGGLQYGYEPGVGLGGSAGTRTPKNGAPRKSVDVGKQYGIDLSDVPIFVRPGPETG